ncbi:MAG: zinc ribbon domain-containing protein [Armatimonadetes bacterium]|nr:zinc ribbon domain-containing protein [Armatimonadota bacterium]
MPIFEYVCMECEHKFEKLVMNPNTEIKCDQCESANLRKLFSVFASTSNGPDMSFGGDGGACGRCGSLERRCE